MAEAVALEVRLGRPAEAVARIDHAMAATPGAYAWVPAVARELAASGHTDLARAACGRALAAAEALPPHRRAVPAVQRRLQEIETLREELK